METHSAKFSASKKALPAAVIDLDNAPEAGDRLERIATAACCRGEARGFLPGPELEDWLQAEAEVDAQTRQ